MLHIIRIQMLRDSDDGAFDGREGQALRVLLVEDDEALARGIQVALRGEGYTLDWLADGRQAAHALRCERFDLVLLDLGLPHLDGLTLLRETRALPHGDVPVLVLTARDAKVDRVLGLDAGADDYLVKPFDLDELKARIRALLRRSQGRAQPLLEHAGISLNPATQQVHYQANPILVTPMEYQLLHQLLIRPGAVVTRERLSAALYGWQDSGPGNTLEVLIHNLRKKLDSALIRTVRGVGYLLEAQP
ncbi:two-component system, OmpR family, response regulator QseB [Pseudomonas asplenii]|uniref:Two-component system, OmpR family, response regulator QseB n=1 Tax=Pseudomonas asplenii TaxID=53407 RepID=A0A1H1XKJ7_9PSED|nr:two-component system, OmpR family, response regulator QseB [Pseudomonas asplenii]